MEWNKLEPGYYKISYGDSRQKYVDYIYLYKQVTTNATVSHYNVKFLSTPKTLPYPVYPEDKVEIMSQKDKLELL